MAKGGLAGVWLYDARLENTGLQSAQLAPMICEELSKVYDHARHAYRALKCSFEGVGDYEAAAWAYVNERRMERACSWPSRVRRIHGARELGDTGEHGLPPVSPCVWWFHLRHTAKWAWDGLVGLACRYGEGLVRTLITMPVTFLAFTAFYWLTWAVTRQVPRGGGVVDDLPTRRVMDVLIFPAGAFTNMDPKGVGPLAPWVQLVATVEALLGIGLSGLLGFVVGYRIGRSYGRWKSATEDTRLRRIPI